MPRRRDQTPLPSLPKRLPSGNYPALAYTRSVMEHGTEGRFVHRHSWRPGDLVIWDNRCTLHRGRAYDDATHPRDLRRVTTQDTAYAHEQVASSVRDGTFDPDATAAQSAAARLGDVRAAVAEARGRFGLSV